MSNQFRVTGMLYSKSEITEYGKNNSKKQRICNTYTKFKKTLPGMSISLLC